MSSREKLIEDIQQLSQSEVLKMRGYLHEIKRTKPTPSKHSIKGAQKVRKALKNLSAPLSNELIEMRNERL